MPGSPNLRFTYVMLTFRLRFVYFQVKKRNYFDVEKYLHRQLKLRKEDVYEVVDADALENAVI